MKTRWSLNIDPLRRSTNTLSSAIRWSPDLDMIALWVNRINVEARAGIVDSLHQPKC